MTVMVLDQGIAARLKAERAATGLDQHDEVWEGIYMMAPIANNEHQDLQGRLVSAFRNALGFDGPERVVAGGNVSDREDDWTHNYRVPDVIVVLPGSAARDCWTHWCGGPDLCVEVITPGDRSRDKLDFLRPDRSSRAAPGGPRPVGAGALRPDRRATRIGRAGGSGRPGRAREHGRSGLLAAPARPAAASDRGGAP